MTEQTADTAAQDGNDTANDQQTNGTGTDPAAEVEKWKSLARKHESAAKANSAAAKRLAELEDANKSELEKLADQLKTAESTGTTHAMAALRLDVALDKAPDGMSPAKIRSLAKRLSGSTREELEADADELFAEFAGPPPAEDKQQQNSKNVRPTPNLRRQVPIPKDDAKQDTAAAMNDWLRKAATR